MRRAAALVLVWVATLAGCSSGPASMTRDRPPPAVPPEVGVHVPHTGAVGDLTPSVPPPSPLGARAADQARALLGAPYRYGGRDPSGFDCSGLVWYVYQALGVELPRRARDQRQSLTAVPRADLEPGDLVFFSRPLDHVGIYLGAGDFVHAPSRGKQVSVASLNAPYFQLGYAGAARVMPP